MESDIEVSPKCVIGCWGGAAQIYGSERFSAFNYENELF